MTSLRELAESSRAWPFEEARKLLSRFAKAPPEKGRALFQTGYGPSGLPHIGTFGEIVRTTMVRRAFEAMSDIPARLFTFSDDMDGLRGVPDTIPKEAREEFEKYKMPRTREEKLRILEGIKLPLETSEKILHPDYHILGGVPLGEIPDPFAPHVHQSFAAYNNAKLETFLQRYGFEYEFKSSTAQYRSGQFNAMLLEVLEHREKITKVVTREYADSKRLEHYDPFLPIVADPLTGKKRTLHVKIDKADVGKGTIAFKNPLDGNRDTELFVTDGNCKLQWRTDWGMRWAAFGVDYEMYGKDLVPSAKLSSQICRTLGAKPPEQLMYEMFLDEKGEKISKSRGNGITIEQWLTYAPEESLALYMYLKPRTAKRLYFDVIPQQVDDYLTHLEKFSTETDEAKKLENPVWHVHSGNPPKPEILRPLPPGESGGEGMAGEKNVPSPGATAPPSAGGRGGIRFGLLLNLAGVSNARDKKTLWGFIARHFPGTTPENSPMLDKLAGYAVAYFHDFVKPAKIYRPANDMEKKALSDLVAALESAPAEATAEDLQNIVYAVGKRHPFENLRQWFGTLYEVLLGEKQGPRMGSFIALYGREETLALIKKALRGESLAA